MRPGIILATLALTVIAFASFSIGTASAKDNPVTVGAFWFCSSSQANQVCETAVVTGDTITWTVQAGTHTVTQCADSSFTNCGTGGFNSGTLNTGGTFVQTFSAAGTSYYRCEFHPTEMRGRIVAAQAVTPSPTPAPSGAATASPTAAPSLPSTGGAPGDNAMTGWEYALLALGGLMLIGAGASVAFAWRRVD